MKKGVKFTTRATILISITGSIFVIVGFAISLRNGIREADLKEIEFPEVEKSDSLLSIVRSVEVNRGTAYIIDSRGKKFRLPWAGNDKYKPYEMSNICNAATVGDTIQKANNSDTIVIKKSERALIFISKKTISIP